MSLTRFQVPVDRQGGGRLLNEKAASFNVWLFLSSFRSSHFSISPVCACVACSISAARLEHGLRWLPGCQRVLGLLKLHVNNNIFPALVMLAMLLGSAFNISKGLSYLDSLSCWHLQVTARTLVCALVVSYMFIFSITRISLFSLKRNPENFCLILKKK